MINNRAIEIDWVCAIIDIHWFLFKQIAEGKKNKKEIHKEIEKERIAENDKKHTEWYAYTHTHKYNIINAQ